MTADPGPRVPAATRPPPGAGGLPGLNIAEFCPASRTLGPGLRAVVWVQGCPFRCRDCLAPDWIPAIPAEIVTAEALAGRILAGPPVTGLTFSGGEPMRQAAGLARLVRLVRARRDVDLIVFTGYRLERLRAAPPGPGVPDLLAQADILIDGLYRPRQDDGLGLRGSANQRVHDLTGRLAPHVPALNGARRAVELHVQADGLLLVGVPAPGMLGALAAAASGAAAGHRERGGSAG